MNDISKILNDIKTKKVSPIYFLTGEEPFFIDQISDFFENHLLSEEEKVFNFSLLYGSDTTIEDIVNSAKEYPMGAERRLIIIKEAQNLKRHIDKLADYCEKPNKDCTLVFCYKDKLDGRKEIGKKLKKHILFEGKKLSENKVPNWIANFVKEKGYKINDKNCRILVELLGQELSLIAKEIEKLFILLPENGEITLEIIEKNIGFRKEFSIFEFQKSIGLKNEVKTLQIAKNYIESSNNPSIIPITSGLYGYFEKLLIAHANTNISDDDLARLLGVHPFYIQDYRQAVKNYTMRKVSDCISVLHKYDLMAKGVDSGSISAGDLLKEMLLFIMR